MPDGSPTRFLHQLRDQSLHLLFGGIGTLPLAFGGSWWAALAVATFYAVVREAEQWPKLNTPSISDSAMDSAFCLLGSQVAWWLVWWLM